MPRTSYRPLAVLAFVVATLAYVGCTNKDSTPTKQNAAVPLVVPPPVPSKDSNKKLFADWPTPEGVLLISGEQDGYLEPCGCTSGQLGGLRRRYDLVEGIRNQKWPLALVDLGGLMKNPAGSRGGFDQAKIKFDIALKAMALLKYDAMALSAEDLKVGVGEAFGQFLNLGDRPKIVVANVTPASGYEQTIRKSVRTSAGKVKLGITAVLDPALLAALTDAEKETLLPTVVPPEKALGEVLADLKKDTDVQVLLVQGDPEMAKSLARQFPEFDIVVETSKFDPTEDAEKLNDGKTLLINVGQKGKYVGAVGLYLDPNQKFRYSRVTLSSRYNGEAEPMRRLIEDDFQQMLKDQQVVEKFPRHNYLDGAPGATFVGAETCKSCHPNTFAKWATTKHAHAFEDIVRDPKGLRSDHQFDAECVSCHTTGFEYNSGWMSAEKTSFLKGNQCENCHGPASKHAAEPDNADFRKAIARTAADADKNRLCLRCHDEDNSPHFDFAKYYGQIAHKGMDTYTDPKVHKGIETKTATPEK